MVTRLRIITLSGLVLVAGLLVIGLVDWTRNRENQSNRAPSLKSAQQAVAKGSIRLRSLYKDANRLLVGGFPAFERQLRALRGHPVVVNKWASWCGPCQAEHSILASVAAEFGDRVAFIGINTDDSFESAQRFLQKHPVVYPSFSDPESKIANKIGAPANFPITVFYDRTGKRRLIRPGSYHSKQQLAGDIRQFLAVEQ